MTVLKTMNCKRAKQELALSAGDDLDAITEQELRRHLAKCPECYDQWMRLRGTTSLLQQVASEEPVSTESPQLWVAIAPSLPKPPNRRSAYEGHGFSLSTAWIPLVAVASLAFAIVSIGQSLDQPDPNSAGISQFAVEQTDSSNTESAYPENHLKFDQVDFSADQYPAIDQYLDLKAPQLDDQPRRAENQSIPGGLYRNNPDDIPTFGVGATLVTTDRLPDDVVHTMVSAIMRKLDDLRALDSVLGVLDAEAMATTGLTAPLHPGAERYFRNAGLNE